MTRKQAEAFIAEWQPLLCPEWEVTVEEGPAPDVAANEHFAAIFNGVYLHATLYLHEVIGDALTPERARRTLLHELLHLTLSDLHYAAKEPTNSLSYDAGRLAQETIERYIERTVDRLATAFAAFTD
jgi:hypothetical protein